MCNALSNYTCTYLHCFTCLCYNLKFRVNVYIIMAALWNRAGQYIFGVSLRHSLCGTDWVKRCMAYEAEGARPSDRPKRTWKEVVQKDCQAHNLNKADAIHCGRWKKLIKIG